MLNQCLQRLCVLAVAISYTGAYLTEPTTTAASDTASDCSSWQVVTGTDTCDSIAAGWLITATAFRAYNPSVGSSCKLVVGNSYCVERNWGLTPDTPTSTTPPTPPTPTNGIATPSPIHTSMVSNCNKFYRIVKDDGCWDVASKSSISLDQLYSWNPALGNDCKSFWPDYNICIGVIGGSPSSSSKPSPTTSPNGINTPSPIQSGMTSNCDEFYLVKDNDGCEAIASSYGITPAQFYAWNPTVGTTCGTLWPKYYVCVSIIGVGRTTLITKTTPTSTAPWVRPPTCTYNSSKGEYVCPSRTPTPTVPANGIATPTPFQSGMASNCKKFYKVVKGDGCWGIADKHKIDLNDFYKWNPALGTSCTPLWPDYYVCVGV